MAEQILAKRVPFWDVMLLLFFSLPSIIALSFPFATLVGALMAMGHFSSKNEILAFLSSGISLGRLFFPLIIIGIIFSFFSFMVNDYFLPLGSLNLNKLYRELLYRNPEIELTPYSVKHYQDSVIITGDVEEGEYNDILIIDKNEKSQRRIIMAQGAKMQEEKKQNSVISLMLEGVLSHSVSPQRSGEFDYDQASSMQYNLLLRDVTSSMHTPGPHEMSSVDVYQVILEKQKALDQRRADHYRMVREKKYKLVQQYASYLYKSDFKPPRLRDNLTTEIQQLLQDEDRQIKDRSLEIWKLEFYQKFSIPFSCLPFVILAFPLGTFSRRSGKSIGFGIGLLLTIIYWGMLFAGRALGLSSGIPPLVTMWFPNMIILFLGLFLLIRRLKQ